MTVLPYGRIQLGVTPDNRGDLYVAESGRNIPFDIARVFTVRGLPKGIVRGNHAHLKTSEVMFCSAGQVALTLEGAGGRERCVLDSPEKAVFIGPLVWITYESLADFSTCTVLASTPFDEADYIRERSAFDSL